MGAAVVSCYAYRDNNGNYDLDSIAETEDICRIKCLQGSMGWRFDSPDSKGGRFDQDKEWSRLLTFGKIVPVMIVPRYLMVFREDGAK